MFKIDVKIWRGIKLCLREKVRLYLLVLWLCFCCLFYSVLFYVERRKEAEYVFVRKWSSGGKKKMAEWPCGRKGRMALLDLKGLTALALKAEWPISFKRPMAYKVAIRSLYKSGHMVTLIYIYIYIILLFLF